MKKLDTVWDYIHDAVTNDKMTYILITSAAEGKIEAEGSQAGMGKTSLGAGLGERIEVAYNGLGQEIAWELVRENIGYSLAHLRNAIKRGYGKRQLYYIADDLQQIAGKHLSHNPGIKWLAYQLTTKRPQLAVFIATAPHIGTLAKAWRELFDWEIKVPVRGIYEVQQIRTRTIFKDPLNPLKTLDYKGESDFPKPAQEFEVWYKQWRNESNESEFDMGWEQYFAKPETKNSKPLTQRHFVDRLRELGIKADDHKLRTAYQELVAPLTPS